MTRTKTKGSRPEIDAERATVLVAIMTATVVPETMITGINAANIMVIGILVRETTAVMIVETIVAMTGLQETIVVLIDLREMTGSQRLTDLSETISLPETETKMIEEANELQEVIIVALLVLAQRSVTIEELITVVIALLNQAVLEVIPVVMIVLSIPQIGHITKTTVPIVILKMETTDIRVIILTTANEAEIIEVECDLLVTPPMIEDIVLTDMIRNPDMTPVRITTKSQNHTNVTTVLLAKTAILFP